MAVANQPFPARDRRGLDAIGRYADDIGNTREFTRITRDLDGRLSETEKALSVPLVTSLSLKRMRVAFSSIAALGSDSILVTWDTPFFDTNYTVTCLVEISGTANVCTSLSGKTTDDATIRIDNISVADATGGGTLHVIAVADQ